MARGLLRNRSLFPSQIVSENAGPHDLHVPSATIGPASYAAPSALAETEGSIQCLASQTVGLNRACVTALGPWKCHQWMEKDIPLVNGLQKEGGLNRCFQHGLRNSVRRLTGLWFKEEGKSLHQLPRNASSVLSSSCLSSKPEGARRSGPLGKYDRGSLHKSP